MALNAKQRRFVDEYLIDLNATQAAIRAGYSEKNADRIGAQLLGKTWVAEAVAERVAERSARTEITQDRVLKELARIAFADKRDVVQWGPGGIEIADSKTLTEDQAAMVSEVSEEDTKFGTRRKVKVHDKVKALELIGKHLGMFRDKVELTGKDGGPVLTKSERDLTDEELAAELAKHGLKP